MTETGAAPASTIPDAGAIPHKKHYANQSQSESKVEIHFIIRRDSRSHQTGGIAVEMISEETTIKMPVSEKYLLTIREAAVYFNIGIKKMRRLAEDNLGGFAVFSGNRYLINRTKFERFIEQSSEI